MSLVQQIVNEIADREGVAPLALQTPLNEAVDTDVLDALDAGSRDRRDGPNAVVEFVYYGYTVSVDGTGGVHVSDQSADSEPETSDASLASLSAETERRADALQAVTDVVAARERPFEERLDGVLAVVRDALAVESATLSYVNDDRYVFEAVDTAAGTGIQSGDVVPLADTNCKRVVETEQALVSRDIEADDPELADSTIDVASYLGMPVFVDGGVYGTFCFYDSEPRNEAFSRWDRTLVELLSKWVSSELERRRHDRELHSTTSERPDCGP